MVIAVFAGLVALVAVLVMIGRRTGTQNGVSCCAPPPDQDVRLINAMREDAAAQSPETGHTH